ncbi:MAG: HAD-IB family phosphatase [Methylococcaceae bacterium]|nr:HAD-IB family phosphatase [Methylococcaceae bacterium]
MSFEIVCFDCDSTLSAIEGIDELANRAGVGAAVAALTTAAMNGEVPLEDVYAQRLNIIKPNQAAIDWVAELYIQRVVDGALKVVQTLQAQAKSVHIISGGLRQAILPLAAYLGVPATNVHAVDIMFNADGSYQGVDTNSLLAKTGGKAAICRQINPAQAKLVLIGDGQTDLEAQLAGATVIGFGGVVTRPAVQLSANYYVQEASLLSVLRFIIS